MNQARASMEHLYRVFTAPEGRGSKLAQIEQHISANLADFLSRHVVASATSLEDIEQHFEDFTLPENPQFVSDHAEQLLEKLVANSVNTYSPQFIGHMTSALPYFHLPLAKLLVGLNQNLVKIETSKAFTPLERQVLGMMHQMVFGHEESFYRAHLHSANYSLGAFCSGGTIANISALWVARNQALPPNGAFKGVSKSGLHAALRHYGYQDMVILTSKRGHYSLSKAADVLGLGRQNLVMLPCPEQTLDPQLVLAEGLKLQQQGIKVLAIVGIAGTTETGHVDPLDQLADVAEQLGCHFHVDAAWGGATLFSKQYRHLLKGVERADSVTLDAHKQMYVPMGAGMVLFKDANASNAVRHHAEYILREGSKDLGASTLEGSRNGMAMMLYASIHIFGRQGYQLLIDESINKARHFANLIKHHDQFELITEPTLCILTYRLCPPAVKGQLDEQPEQRQKLNQILDNLTVAVQKRQREAGKSFVSRTRLATRQYDGQTITVFRVVLANPLTTSAHLQDILQEQVQIAQQTRSWLQLSQQ